MLTAAFQKDLEALLNQHSIDSLCNVPDYLLAEHIFNYLMSLQQMNRAVDIWYGRTTEGANAITASRLSVLSGEGSKKEGK